MSRPPQPFHVQLGGVYWVLAKDQAGRLAYQKNPLPFFPPRISDAAATQASFPPDARVPYSFSVRSGGFGQPRQDTAQETDRYYYGDARSGHQYEGVDASLGDRVILGPQINVAGLGGFVPTDGYFLTLGASLLLAATDGANTRVFRWNTATFVWDLQATLTGLVVTDAITYLGAQAQTYAYLAAGPAALMQWSTDGTTWASVGANAAKANKLAKIDGELWKEQNGTVTKCSDGGGNPTFASPIVVGDGVGVCNGLYNHGDRLVVGKSTGLFILAHDRATLDQNLWPDLWTNGPDTTTFAGGITWREQLWVPAKRGFYAISSAYLTAQVGISHILDNDSPVSGQLTAPAADNFHLYAVAGSGYLLKGVVAFEHGLQGVFVKGVSWHPISYLGTTGLRAFVWNGVTGTTPELYLLLANGQVARAILSATGNPLTDSRYRFASAGVLYESRFYAGFTKELKDWFSITPDTIGLATGGTGQQIQHGTRTLASGDWADFALVQDTDPGIRNEPTTVPRSRWIDVRSTLTTGDVTKTPQLRSVTIDSATEPLPLWQHEFTIDLSRDVMRTDNTRQRLDPSTARMILEGLVSSGPIGFTDPWGITADVTIPLDGLKSVAGIERTGTGKESDLQVPVVARETKQRLPGTFARLATFTFAQLASDTFTQLRTL